MTSMQHVRSVLGRRGGQLGGDADADLKGVDAVIVPGGFSYGDYLRAGAIASLRTRDGEVIAARKAVCRSSESATASRCCANPGLLPGALTRNENLHFICRDQWLTVASNATAWSSRYEPNAEILVPLKSGEGRFQAPQKVLDELEGEGRVVLRYSGEN